MKTGNCFLFFILAVFITGCQSTFGPRALEQTHPAYNEAIVGSLNQQMLRNLVRLRYRDVPFFLDVGSVTATLSLDANAALNAEVDIGPGGNILSPGVGIAYSQSPTISYTPLRGENLLKSILSPLRLESILVLTQSGWSIERVFGLCLERINNLANAPTASGPTPVSEPVYQDFRRLLELLRKLQEAGLIEIGTEQADDTQNIVIRFITGDPSYTGVFAEIRRLLDLDDDVDRFVLNTDFLELSKDQWSLRTRSISSLLYYLSQNVAVPEEHRVSGLVTTTRTRNGNPFDWNSTPAGNLFRVNVSAERPTSAYVTTSYRGYWFYIADNDLQSKSSFMLLRQLFNLQAGQTRFEGPTLTLPVGGR